MSFLYLEDRVKQNFGCYLNSKAFGFEKAPLVACVW